MSAPLLRFRAMGCDVRVAGATAEEARRIRALFDRHERRFSRFIDGSELNAVTCVSDVSCVAVGDNQTVGNRRSLVLQYA